MSKQIIFTFNNIKSFTTAPESFENLLEFLKEEFELELELNNNDELIIKDINKKIILNNNDYLKLIEESTPEIFVEIKKKNIIKQPNNKKDFQNIFLDQFESLLENNLMKLKKTIKDDQEDKKKRIETINTKLNNLLNDNQLTYIESKINQYFDSNSNDNNQNKNIINEIKKLKNESLNESIDEMNNEIFNKIPEQLNKKINEINKDINRKYPINELINKNNKETKVNVNNIIEEIQTIPNINNDNNEKNLDENLNNFKNIKPIQNDNFNIIEQVKKNSSVNNKFKNISAIKNEYFDIINNYKHNNPISNNDLNNNINQLIIEQPIENDNNINSNIKNGSGKLIVKLITTKKITFTLFELKTQRAFINVKITNVGDLTLSGRCCLKGIGYHLYIDTYLIRNDLHKNNIKEFPNIPIKIKPGKNPNENEKIKLILYNEDGEKKLAYCFINIEVTNLNEKIEIPPKNEYKEGNIHILKRREDEEKEEKSKLMNILNKIKNDEKFKEKDESKDNKSEDSKNDKFEESGDDDILEESEDEKEEESEEKEEEKKEDSKEECEENKENEPEYNFKNDSYFSQKFDNIKQILTETNDDIIINSLIKCKGNLELTIDEILNKKKN
jgi:hypothetical protein